MSDRSLEHAEILEQLQDMMLQDLKRTIESGEMSSTDRKTILDFLRANGWAIKPTQALGNSVLDKLKERDFTFEDDDVIPLHKTGT